MIKGKRVLILDGTYGCGNVGRVVETNDNLVLVDMTAINLGRAWVLRGDLRVLEEEEVMTIER